MKLFSLSHLVAAAVFASGIVSAGADVKLPSLFGDNIVLQAPKAVVFGTADPHEAVKIKINVKGSKGVTVTAGADGKWKATLQRLKTGGPYELTVSGSNAITIHNVAVGDVWLCAGASNMAMPVNSAENSAKEMAAAKFPALRFFQVAAGGSAAPAAEIQGRWIVCDPDSVKEFSAAAYFFGRDLQQKVKSPIGLIQSTASATPAEAWIGTAVMESKFKPLLDQWKTETEDYPQAKEAYGQLYATWKQEVQQAKSASQPAPPPPRRPKAPDDPAAPSGVYNAMIAPLIPFTIKGTIWYQGESDVHDPKQYAALFPALIESWRTAWGQGDFPFLFVQLANFLPHAEEPSDSLWAELREAQAGALKLPATGMAVAIDIGNEHGLLPTNKEEAGRRLALAAEQVAYGMDITGEEPRFSGMKITGGKARLTFASTGGGLTVKGEPLKGFAIAGPDKRFFPGNAKIEKNKITVSSDKVPKPVAVRYAWADTPECNLYNKENLPAVPFRTDNWAQTVPITIPDAASATPTAP